MEEDFPVGDLTDVVAGHLKYVQIIPVKKQKIAKDTEKQENIVCFVTGLFL